MKLVFHYTLEAALCLELSNTVWKSHMFLYGTHEAGGMPTNS